MTITWPKEDELLSHVLSACLMREGVQSVHCYRARKVSPVLREGPEGFPCFTGVGAAMTL